MNAPLVIDLRLRRLLRSIIEAFNIIAWRGAGVVGWRALACKEGEALLAWLDAGKANADELCAALEHNRVLLNLGVTALRAVQKPTAAQEVADTIAALDSTLGFLSRSAAHGGAVESADDEQGGGDAA